MIAGTVFADAVGTAFVPNPILGERLQGEMRSVRSLGEGMNDVPHVLVSSDQVRIVGPRLDDRDPFAVVVSRSEAGQVLL
jgi:hypothetical protein